MITKKDIEIDAPASVVWDLYADVEHWSDWTTSIRKVVGLDGSELAVGRKFRVEQPRMPALVWEVTDYVPGASWTWRQRSFGASTIATHEVVALSAERAEVRQALDQRGVLGVPVGFLMRGMTKRYLELEANGLKARSESRHRADATTA
jgi:uncharacterized membrane protein